MFGKRGADEKYKQANPFSRVSDEKGFVFSGEEEITPVFSRFFFFFNNLLTPSPRKALMNEVVSMVTFSLPFFSALYQFRPFKL